MQKQKQKKGYQEFELAGTLGTYLNPRAGGDCLPGNVPGFPDPHKESKMYTERTCKKSSQTLLNIFGLSPPHFFSHQSARDFSDFKCTEQMNDRLFAFFLIF